MESGQNVKLYVYDLSRGMARTMSPMLLGKQLEGIWHTAIVVFGKEWFYGGMAGIESCRPGGLMQLGQPTSIVDMGNTFIPEEVFKDLLEELSQDKFRGDRYHLLDHNCNTFSNELAQFLTSNPIPAHITSLPADVMSTPMGAMIRPFIDAMSVSPAGATPLHPTIGHAGGTPLAAEKRGTQNTRQNQAATAKPAASAVPPGPANGAGAGPHTAAPAPAATPPAYPVFTLDKLLTSEDIEKVKSFASGLDDMAKQCLTEVVEFSSEPQPSWGLGRFHLRFLAQHMSPNKSNSSTSGDVQVSLARGLGQCCLSSEVMGVLRGLGAQEKLVPVLRTLCDSSIDGAKVAVAQSLTNCSSHASGRALLQYRGSDTDSGVTWCDVTRHVCVTCILDERTEVSEAGLKLACNLVAGQPDDDTCIEVGSALMEHSHKAVGILGDTLTLCIDRLFTLNTQLVELSQVVGFDADILTEKTPGACEAKKRILGRLGSS